MAYAFVQFACNFTGTGGTALATTDATGDQTPFPSNITVGNLLYVLITYDNTAGVSDTVSDNLGNTYTLIDRVNDTTDNQVVAQYSAPITTGGTCAPKLNTPNSNPARAILVAEYSGLSSTVDGHHAGARQSNPGTTANALTSGNGTNTVQPAAILAGTFDVSSVSVSTAGTGFTSRGTGGLAANVPFINLFDKRTTTAGAQAATATATDGTGAHVTLMAMFDEAGSSNTTITPTQGSLALTGLAAIMGLGMTPSTGSAAFQGYAPTLVRTSPQIAPTQGSLNFQGLAPVIDYDIPPTQGALAFAGQAPTLFISSGRVITPGNAALTLTGPTVAQAWTDLTGQGNAAWQGYAPVVSVSTSGSTQISPQQADMAFVGYAVSQLLTLVPPAPAVLAFQGYAPFLGGNIIANPSQAALAFQGYAPILGLPTQTGSLSWQGQAPALAYTLGAGTPAALAFTGQAPVVTYSGLTTPGSLSFQGYAPVVSNQMILTPQTGTLSFNGTVTRISFLAASPGSLAFTGLAPTVTNSGQHLLTSPHYMQRFPIGTDGTVQCVDVTRAVAPFVFWNENKVDTNGRLMVVVDGLPAGWDDGLQVTASECIIVTRTPIGPATWTDGLQLDSRGFLCVTDNPTLPVFNMQGMQFDSNGYLVVTIG
jgi:hypothetical protein